jgi:Domain of unknown function (DUF4303)
MSNNDLRSLVATVVKTVKVQIDKKYDKSPLSGFALCTDDDVRNLYHVACTRTWVDEQKESDPDIGYVYVDWDESCDDSLFDKINTIMSQLADQDFESADDWANARDRRFESLVLGLSDCRTAKIFDKLTLLCVGSTDPSDHLEGLAMDAVDRLNSSEIADGFAVALEYEKYRKSTKQTIATDALRRRRIER